MCCVSVNCSITSATVVHFLHQTDIGLALRKHKVIYSISPTLFSPSHSLPHSLFAFLLCKQETGVSCISSTGLTCPFSFSSLNLFQKFSPLLSPCSFLPLPPSPCFSSSLQPLSLCLCFPLLNCFAVDLTAMINDLEATGKQTQRDTTCMLFSYKPPFFLIYLLLLCSHIMTSRENIFELRVRLYKVKIWYTFQLIFPLFSSLIS